MQMRKLAGIAVFGFLIGSSPSLLAQEKAKPRMVRPQLKAKKRGLASGKKGAAGRAGKLENSLSKGISADETKQAAAKKAKAAMKKGKKGKGGDKFAEIKARAEERKAKRAERAQESRGKVRARVKTALKGKPMDEALKQELKRHARRSARLARVQEVAADKGDAKAIARCEKLTEKEHARHGKWMTNYGTKPQAEGETK